MTKRMSLVAAAVTAALWLATPAWADLFFFSPVSADGRLGALSQPPSSGKLETETADDFTLTETTSIAQATIVGLIAPGTPLANILNVEVEVYHVFPTDSDTSRCLNNQNPPCKTVNVPTRINSPADVEIDAATRDGSVGTLGFSATLLKSNFVVENTVVTGINKDPDELTHGEGSVTGDLVQITMTFDPPILLPAEHYFFRPEVQVSGSDFLYVSTPRPAVTGDLQAWIRNSDLKPDWLRIGTDIIGGTTFNMTFSLAGETIPGAGTPGQAECQRQTVSALARQFGGFHAAASTLGFSSVKVLQKSVTAFCEQ